MNKTPKSESAPNQHKSRQQKFRNFVFVPGAGWKAIGGMRSMKPRKALYLPECAGMTVRAALANVKIERSKPVVLNYLRMENWKIGDDGVADEADQFQHVFRRITTAAGDDADTAPTQEETEAIKRCLGISSA